AGAAPRATTWQPRQGNAGYVEILNRLLVRIDLQQLELEHQRGIGRDHAAGAASAVAEFGGNQQGALAAHVHAGHALVPTLDDHALAQGEGERFVAVVGGAVELRAVLVLGGVVVQPAGVEHLHGHAGLGLGTTADLGVDGGELVHLAVSGGGGLRRVV